MQMDTNLQLSPAILLSFIPNRKKADWCALIEQRANLSIYNHNLKKVRTMSVITGMLPY